MLAAFQNVLMTKTLGGREEMEREELKYQSRMGLSCLPENLNSVLDLKGHAQGKPIEKLEAGQRTRISLFK